ESNILDLISLVISAAIPVAKVIAGNITCIIVPRPETGKTPNVTENNKISIIPNQKLGIALPITAAPVAIKSKLVFCLVADQIPKGIATIVAIIIAIIANSSVAGSLSSTTSNAG